MPVLGHPASGDLLQYPSHIDRGLGAGCRDGDLLVAVPERPIGNRTRITPRRIDAGGQVGAR